MSETSLESIFFAALERPPERACRLSWTAPVAATPSCGRASRRCSRLNRTWASSSTDRTPSPPRRCVRAGAFQPPRTIPARSSPANTSCCSRSAKAAWAPSGWPSRLQPVKRHVAVKLIRTEPGSSETILARFEAERQAMALMDHPNIAKLLDAGTTERAARPAYFVMELVKGVPLTELLRRAPAERPRAAEAVPQICSAVQHAHQKGIIHRDLKPTQHPGRELTTASPVPKVIDFGLAKATGGHATDRAHAVHRLRHVAGTPLYMAPEQATFNALDVDTRADIYALGVILYELLTGTHADRARHDETGGPRRDAARDPRERAADARAGG